MHEIFDQFKQQLPDIDPAETQEWLDSLDGVVAAFGMRALAARAAARR